MYVCVCMYACMHIITYMYVCISGCIYLCMNVCMYVCIYGCIHVRPLSVTYVQLNPHNVRLTTACCEQLSSHYIFSSQHYEDTIFKHPV
jgi:hypothetical protein